MRLSLLMLIACCSTKVSFAWQTSQQDSAAKLDEVVVTAFYGNAKWESLPAAIATINREGLQKISPVTLVSSFNTIPGVRMEERSPASYRLSFRGSLLRSPFGVRNIKVYWNDFPLTDGGGNTYLNLLSVQQLSGAELLKGPAASVYGAGTGGALLLRSVDTFSLQSTHHFEAGLLGGSYGLLQQQAGWQYSNQTFHSSLQQVHTQSDGYRQQSAMRRDGLQWNGAFSFKQQQLKFLLFYTNLYYQTPGGITLAQMQQDPQLARQPAGNLPGAVQQKTAIYNSTFFAGISHEAALSDVWQLKSFVTANATRFRNPFITNYEKRAEDNLGAGFHFSFHPRRSPGMLQWVSGAEWLYNRSAIDDYGNRAGVQDTVQFKDKVHAAQWFLFTQASYRPGAKWDITAGLSLNNQSYSFIRLSDPSPVEQRRQINAVLTPRIALSYRLKPGVTIYALIAKGFSPPTQAELRPADRNYHGDLNAEQGWNYEAGIKGYALNRRLQFDVAAYYFRLQDAIVRRVNSAGAEYFVNAGGAVQKGVEALLRYRLPLRPQGFINQLQVWSSYSYQPYYFEGYKQGTIDYSGNTLTGVPRNGWVSGLDLETKNGLYSAVSLNATSSLPLTDANDVYAAAYQLLQWKAGYRWKKNGRILHFFAGVDNLLNQVYSLGNDINAVGKRFYNPAPGRNFFAGVQYSF